jgi:hypothetical protein
MKTGVGDNGEISLAPNGDWVDKGEVHVYGTAAKG